MRLVIELSEDGKIHLEGPLDNKLLCYGILECGRDAIQTHHEELQKAAAKRLVEVSALPPGLQIPGVHLGRKVG